MNEAGKFLAKLVKRAEGEAEQTVQSEAAPRTGARSRIPTRSSAAVTAPALALAQTELMTSYSVVLVGGPPWGLRISGAAETNGLILVTQVSQSEALR